MESASTWSSTLHLEHGALVGVHGGFPQLGGIHFAQPLEALHGERFLPHRHDVLHQFLAILDGQSAAVGGDGEGRAVIFMHALVQIEEAAVFGAGEQVPIEGAFRLRLAVEGQEVDVVLLVQLDVGLETLQRADPSPPFPASPDFRVRLSWKARRAAGRPRAAHRQCVFPACCRGRCIRRRPSGNWSVRRLPVSASCCPRRIPRRGPPWRGARLPGGTPSRRECIAFSCPS